MLPLRFFLQPAEFENQDNLADIFHHNCAQIYNYAKKEHFLFISQIFENSKYVHKQHMKSVISTKFYTTLLLSKSYFKTHT